MFCSHCGESLPDGVRFCGQCGTHAGAPETELTRDEPTLVLRPEFVPRLAILSLMPLQVFLGVWAAGFFGLFGSFLLESAGVSAPAWLPFLAAGVVFFVGIPLLAYPAQRKTYQRTEYRFFGDKLDYFEGYFNVEEKSIPLARVTEVNLRKGVLQRKHGLGTIVLSTPASAGAGNPRAGIRIADVADPDAVYGRIKQLVEQASRGNARRFAA